MPNAKKLPSGSWRCQAYSHSVPVLDKEGNPVLNRDGSLKKKKVYVSFTSKNKKEAEHMATAFALDKESYSKAQKEDIMHITFGAALDAYIAKKTPALSPRSISDYKCTRRNHLKSLMNLDIYKITADDIQLAINADIEGHSPKTVYNHHGLIVAVFKMYRPEFAFHTTLPKKVRPELYVPTDADIRKLLAVASGTDMELPVLLAAFGPMRRGEIAALTSGNISGNTVHVCSTMVLDLNRNWIIKAPKSYAGDRYIIYPDFVVKKWEGTSGRITRLHPNNITDKFAKLLKKADVPHFRFHDLRHYCASIQHALGIPDAYIMSRGGWGSDTVLKAVYRHTMSDREKEMNSKANDHFSSLIKQNITRNITQNKNPLNNQEVFSAGGRT